jgi:hypothetical protein
MYILIEAEDNDKEILELVNRNKNRSVVVDNIRDIITAWNANLYEDFVSINNRHPLKNEVMNKINLYSWFLSVKNKKSPSPLEQEKINLLSNLEVIELPKVSISDKLTILKYMKENFAPYKKLVIPVASAEKSLDAVFFKIEHYLRPRELQAFIQRYAKNEKMKIISENMGCSASRVGGILDHAKKKLLHIKIASSIVEESEK